MRKRMAGSDFGFMTVLVKEGNVVVRHVIAVNVITYPDSETPLFSKEKNNRCAFAPIVCYAWLGSESAVNVQALTLLVTGEK